MSASGTAQSSFHPFRSEKARQGYLANYDRRASQWPVAAQGRLVETSGGQTYVRISGPSDAPPLVLLPGVNASSLMWLPNISELSQNYRVYAVDNIYDFGRSVWKRPMLTASDFVNWLDELFTQLGLGENINLMGISYGGWIASQYALHRPGRLKKLVLLARLYGAAGAGSIRPARHAVHDPASAVHEGFYLLAGGGCRGQGWLQPPVGRRHDR